MPWRLLLSLLQPPLLPRLQPPLLLPRLQPHVWPQPRLPVLLRVRRPQPRLPLQPRHALHERLLHGLLLRDPQPRLPLQPVEQRVRLLLQQRRLLQRASQARQTLARPPQAALLQRLQAVPEVSPPRPAPAHNKQSGLQVLAHGLRCCAACWHADEHYLLAEACCQLLRRQPLEDSYRLAPLHCRCMMRAQA